MALLLPSLSSIRETTRRVVCGSNIRQQGLGIAMFAEDNANQLPPSQFLPASDAGGPGFGRFAEPVQSQQTIVARIEGGQWDGLGLLYRYQFLPTPGVFYCPSHHGLYPLRTSAPLWNLPTPELVTNYQYRGGEAVFSSLAGDRAALVTDGLRTQDDYSHRVGSNVLRSDLSVVWFSDPGSLVLTSLPLMNSVRGSGGRVDQAWESIDRSAR